MHRNKMMSSYLALWENSLVTSPPSEGVQGSGPAAERHYSAITQRGFQLAAYKMCSSSACKSFLLVNTRLFAHMLARSVPPSAHVSSAWVGLWDRDSLYGAELHGPQSNCNFGELWIFSAPEFFFINVLLGHQESQLPRRKPFFSLFVFPRGSVKTPWEPLPTHAHTRMYNICRSTPCFFFFFFTVFLRWSSPEDKKMLNSGKLMHLLRPSIPQASIIAVSGAEREQPLCYFRAQ